MKPKLTEEYHKDGSIERQTWRLNGKLHREDGPAIIHYYKDRSIKFQQWLANGKKHREDGPAWIRYNKDGSIAYQRWYLNGRVIFKEDFTSLDMIKRMNAFPLFTVKEIARMKLDEPI